MFSFMLFLGAGMIVYGMIHIWNFALCFIELEFSWTFRQFSIDFWVNLALNKQHPILDKDHDLESLETTLVLNELSPMVYGLFQWKIQFSFQNTL